MAQREAEPESGSSLVGGIAPGQMIGPFRLVRILGQGGMGTVYEALHEVTGQRVALKRLDRGRFPDEKQHQLGIREARALAAVSHPGLVQFYGFDELPDGTPYLTMELLTGETLRARLRRPHQLAVDEVLHLTRQAAEALAAAHGHGIVHRDVKPENLMLLPADSESQPAPARLKILDFGVAKLVAASGLGTLHSADSHLLGTPMYMSPEQCRTGERITEKSDVYSLGVVLFEMLCGQPPFVAEPVQLLLLHLYQSPPRPRRLRPDLPASIEDLILHMLAKPPARRPSMKQVAAALASPLLVSGRSRIGRLLERSPFRALSSYTLRRVFVSLKNMSRIRKLLLALTVFWVYWNSPFSFGRKITPIWLRQQHLAEFRDPRAVRFFAGGDPLGRTGQYYIHVDINVFDSGDLHISRIAYSDSYTGAHISGCLGLYDAQDRRFALLPIRRCGVGQSRLYFGRYDEQHPRVCVPDVQHIEPQKIEVLHHVRIHMMIYNYEFPNLRCNEPEVQDALARSPTVDPTL